MVLKNLNSDNALTGSDTTTSETINTIVGSLKTIGVKRVHIAIGISGGTVIAFDQFALQGRIRVGQGSWLSIQTAWGTTEEDTLILRSPVALETLAHGASSFAIVDIEGFEEIRVQSAQAASTASAVTRALTITVIA